MASVIRLVGAILFAIAGAVFAAFSAPPRIAPAALGWRPIAPVGLFVRDEPNAPTARDGFRIEVAR